MYQLRSEVESLPFVAGTAQRTVLQGMINSAKSARAVRIMGFGLKMNVRKPRFLTFGGR